MHGITFCLIPQPQLPLVYFLHLLNNYQPSSSQVFCYGNKIHFSLTVIIISYWNHAQMVWESRRDLQAFQTPLRMSLLKGLLVLCSDPALTGTKRPKRSPKARDHHLHRSRSSQGTNSIIPQGQTSTSCPQLDNSFHQKPLAQRKAHR